jgi:hypothetical protein
MPHGHRPIECFRFPTWPAYVMPAPPGGTDWRIFGVSSLFACAGKPVRGLTGELDEDACVVIVIAAGGPDGVWQRAGS